MNFPSDADGDVLRRLESTGFDFSSQCEIEFNVDFATWPPSKNALSELEKEFGNIEIYEPEDECDGYVVFNVKSILSYELVTQVQKTASATVIEHGGICESWGLFS
ncbi:ribonuclease E inhibitor RraB [Alteromonas sp. W364]|uniref:ribonuclease E inhibitor RraB n=1 Tax=Alteromonas sp. W364 TaxID=3075610 RepID=UPI002884D915|nr:ribonuclease E inhibitor RraB [Alteromonas sp. W364]MDT0630107.1 ribonuclease E inhibitor RraB [Alteromonas sp. W364]